jgi:hypothetical protein
VKYSVKLSKQVLTYIQRQGNGQGWYHWDCWGLRPDGVRVWKMQVQMRVLVLSLVPKGNIFCYFLFYVYFKMYFSNNFFPKRKEQIAVCIYNWTIGVLGFDSRRGLGIFLFTTASRPALGPTQPPIQ